MFTLQEGSFRAIYASALEHLLSPWADDVAPRGQATKECRGALLEFDSRYALLPPCGRKLNYHFALAEFFWMLQGRNDVETIGRYNTNLANFSDDESTFTGAYGPKLVEQL